MAKVKELKGKSKPAADPLAVVKGAGISKRSNIPDAKAKKVTKAVVNGKEKRKPKVVEPSSDEDDDSEDSDSSNQSDSDASDSDASDSEQVTKAAPKANGKAKAATKAPDSDKDEDSADSSDSDKAKPANGTKAAAESSDSSDSSDNEDSDEESDDKVKAQAAKAIDTKSAKANGKANGKAKNVRCLLPSFMPSRTDAEFSRITIQMTRKMILMTRMPPAPSRRRRLSRCPRNGRPKTTRIARSSGTRSRIRALPSSWVTWAGRSTTTRSSRSSSTAKTS